RLWTKDKKPVVEFDNSEGLSFDGRFEHVFATAGRYIVEVRDTRFLGGANWVYHLRLGDFPTGRVSYPAGGRRGSTVAVTLPTQTAATSAVAAADPASLDDMQSVSARGANASVWTPFVVDDRSHILEIEPNDEAATSTPVVLPATLHGRIQTPGDSDYFQFTAKKDSQLKIVADTRRLGSPADVFLTLVNETGGDMAYADDVGYEEGIVQAKIPADGTYRLAVFEASRRGGPDFVYRVELEAAPSTFDPTSGVDRFVVPQGGVAPFAFSVARQNFAGPLTYALQPVAPSSSGPKAVVGGLKLQGDGAGGVLTLTAAADAPLGLSTVRIVAAGAVDGANIVRSFDASAVLSAKMNKLRQLPPNAVREIPVLVVEPPVFSLTAKLAGPRVARFLKTNLEASVAKAKFFDEEVTVVVANLPANVTVAAKPIPKGQQTVALEIESKPNTPVGDFTLIVSGKSTRGGRPFQLFAAALPIQIGPAFSLTFAASEVKMKPGTKTKIIVTAERLAGFEGPIAVTLPTLPKGVTAAAATIAEKQPSVEIELTAAADAPAGTLAAAAAGAAKVAGQEEKATSQPTNVVVAP
ncbi:MAG: PPC domain-containing protein, partial [Planctomycetia bacterium]